MPDNERDDRLAEDAVLLEQAVREAGATALEYFGAEQDTWSKADDSPVSDADFAADRVLTAALRGARPDYGWMSEESPRHDGDPAWIVDPIDGTRAFLRQSTEWTVSAALVAGGRPVAAAAFNPCEDMLFSAVAGGGARLNGTPLSCSTRTDIAGARLLAERHVIDAKRWRTPWPSVETRSVSSVVHRLCLVACGRYDATISASAKSDWDLAAADLIVREAGGMVSTFTGTEMVYNRRATRHPNVVAAGGALHARLIAFIGESDRRHDPAGQGKHGR